MQANQTIGNQSRRNNALDKQLETIGWGLFLVLIGGIWLVPDAHVPQEIWLIGAAAIMLGLNAVRYLNGIRTSRFTISLGFLAMAAGLGSLFGLKLPILAIVLLFAGVSIILKALFQKRE